MNAVREYLNEKFVLQDGNGGRMRLTLENLEEKDEWCVMELKAKAPAGLAGARLRNLLLFELQKAHHRRGRKNGRVIFNEWRLRKGEQAMVGCHRLERCFAAAHLNYGI